MLYCVYRYIYIAISIIVVLSPKWPTLNGLRGYWVLILRCGRKISIFLFPSGILLHPVYTTNGSSRAQPSRADVISSLLRLASFRSERKKGFANGFTHLLNTADLLKVLKVQRLTLNCFILCR